MGFDWSFFMSWDFIAMVIDVLIIWFFIYRLLLIVRNTQSINILNGILVIILMKIFSSVLSLQAIDWILNQIINWLVLAVIVIFQPEIRRGLEHLGRNFLHRRNDKVVTSGEELVDNLVDASIYMSKRRIGALIVLEGETNLQEYIDTGTYLGANTTNQLLINIFVPNTPLHDGAVIIRGNRIQSAASYLPLSENPDIPKELGTRHRAAIGLTEQTDALVLIVSEETGSISVATRANLKRDLTADGLREELQGFLVTEEKQKEENLYDTLFRNRGDDE